MRKISQKFSSITNREQKLKRPLQIILNRILFDLHSPLGRNANLLGIVIIFFSVLLSMTATIPSISDKTRESIHLIEVVVTLLCALEYLLRLYAGRWPLRYAFSFYGIVDLLTWIPLLLFNHIFLAIRLLRIIRLLKLVRYLGALRVVFSSITDVFDVVFVVLATIVIIVLISGNLIFYLEPETFPNAYIGCWWSLVTMTTVGYGDIVPITIIGKIEAAVLMLTGITMFALLTGIMTIRLGEHLKNRSLCIQCNKRISPNANYCSHCGHPQHPNGSDINK